VRRGGHQEWASAIRFTNPTTVGAIEAKFRVMEAEANSCSDLPAVASAGVSGSFFNGGGGTPLNNRTNDVRAGVTIRLASGSLDPEVLSATAFVSKCGDAQCTVNTTLTSAALGTIALKDGVRVRVEWDEPNDQFVFQLGRHDPVFLSYADDVLLPAAPAGVNEKVIQARNTVAGCAGGLRSVAFMDLHVDDVRVNDVP
jgi:hypothetical protein